MAEGMKECPFCGAEVKKTNFNRHLRKVHGDLDKKEFEKEGIASPIKTKSKARVEREEKKQAAAKARQRKRSAGLIAGIVIVIVIVSVVGVIVYQNLTSNEPNGGTSNGNTTPTNPVAVMSTTMGTIKIELYETEAPITVANFKTLANNGFFDNLIFHRVVPNFVIQGGGFDSNGVNQPSGQIAWEDTGYTNQKYTIAMARSGDPNSQQDSGSATSQFFINLNNNANLDSYTYPYVVFGKVIEGFGVVDAIGVLPTGTHNGMDDWPDNPPVIYSVIIQE